MSPRTDALRRAGLRAASLTLAGSSLMLAGCQDSLARRDTISAQAGDAIAANKAIHIIDPWPAAAARTDIPVSGRKVVQAIERYERGTGGETSAPGAAASAAQPALPPPVTQ